MKPYTVTTTEVLYIYKINFKTLVMLWNYNNTEDGHMAKVWCNVDDIYCYNVFVPIIGIKIMIRYFRE